MLGLFQGVTKQVNLVTERKNIFYAIVGFITDFSFNMLVVPINCNGPWLVCFTNIVCCTFLMVTVDKLLLSI